MKVLNLREVQDLAWVIQSPPVISGSYNGARWLDSDFFNHEFNECSEALRHLDKNPQDLQTLLAKEKPYILGRRFEVFIEYWLRISPNYKVLEKNFVLQGENRTLGEIDFIILDIKRDKIIHLEVSVKFYLKKGDSELMSDWYGSNLKDRLDLKFTKLVEHQTQLSVKYPDLLPYTIDERWCIFKGRMFYPSRKESQIVNPEAFFDKHFLQGEWSYLKDLDSSCIYQHLNKQQWLRRLDNFSGTELNLGESLELSKCCAEFSGRSSSEAKRVFVMPDNFWLDVPL